MSDLIVGSCLILAALAVAIRSHLDKRDQRRKQLQQRLREYPLDAFPQQHYELTPHDVAVCQQLVDGVKR
jgi:hypothetical protein